MEFQFGDWLVSPEANFVSNGDLKTPLEPRVMAVLRYLCRHPGAVIPAEEILQACWGSSELGDNPVHKAITQLRRAFGDSSTEPRYIETIRKRGYRAIAPVVTFAAPPATTWEGGSPFRGLEAFQENHAAIFFGRVQATAQLRELVLTQAAHGCPMALVLGPSGSGKTSLVRAGLLPQLMEGAIRSDEPVGLFSTVYLDCADLGSGTLFQALAGALIDAEINGGPLFPGSSADSLGQRLASEPDAVAAELRERACPRAAVGVFVDRLEAVFRESPAEASSFIAVLDQLTRSNCLLILMACRNDFYPEIMAQPLLVALKSRGAHFDVSPPNAGDIAQIVRQPALAAHVSFEKDESTGASLDDVICDAARGSPDVLPLLQYCLNELYRQRTDDDVLRFDVYHQLGGIEGAIGARAEQVVSTLQPSQIAALPRVLSLLVNIGEEQGAVTARRSPLSMLGSDDEKELVRVMVEARLFVSELAADVPSFGVAHEALLRRWIRVAEWIERSRHSLQLRSRVESQALHWEAGGRARDLLLPSGIQVNQAADLLKLPDLTLTPPAAEYVRASVTRAKLGERVRIGVTTLVAFLAVLAGVLGLAARGAQRQAEQKRTEAEELMTFMLGDFVEKLRPIGRLDLLDDVGKKALSYLGKDYEGTEGDSLVQRIKALRVIAEVSFNRGKPDDARQALETARTLMHTAPRSLNSHRDYLKERAANAFLLGQMYLSQHEVDKAEQYLREAKAHSEAFAALDQDAVDGLLELSYAHNSLGSLAMTLSDYHGAAAEFERSLELKKQAIKRKPNDTSIKADIANSISWLAESKLKLGATHEAMRLYREEEAQLRPIATDNANWSSRLGLSLMRQSALSTALGDRNLAIRTMKDAQDIAHALVAKDPSNRNWRVRMLQAEGRLLEVELTPQNAAASLERLQQVSDKLAELSKLDSKNTFISYLIIKFDLLRSSILQQLGRIDAAIRNTDEIVTKLAPSSGGAKQDNQLRIYLAEGLLIRAELHPKARDLSAASEYCKRAIDVLAPISVNTNDHTLLSLKVRAHLCAGKQEAVLPQINQLSKMGFREARYQQYVISHTLLKGKQ